MSVHNVFQESAPSEFICGLDKTDKFGNSTIIEK